MSSTIMTYSGLTVDPLNFTPGMFRIEDVAHSLARLCRYTGHVRYFRSVALHSVEVMGLVAEHTPDLSVKLLALLHDAPEAYLNDIPGPVKSALGIYRTEELRILHAIFEAIGVPYPEHGDAIVHRFDQLNGEAERSGAKNGTWKGFDHDARAYALSFGVLTSLIHRRGVIV